MRLALAAAVLLLPLLGGCVDEPPVLQAQAATIEAAPTPGFPGLGVRGTLAAEDGRLVVTAFARNDGNRTYRIEAACGPWSDGVYRGTERLETREPGECQGFALQDLPPGTALTHTFAWDGRIWHERSGRRLDAPAGEYVWSVRFAAYQPDGAQLKRFDLDFNVTVR